MKYTKALLAAITATGFACADGVGPGSTLTLSFVSAAPGVAVSLAQQAGAALSVAEPITDGQGNALSITRAQVVLREIELKRVEHSSCDSLQNDDSCEEFEAGPLLIDLPVDGSVDQTMGIDAPIGSYDELEFEIHKVSNDDDEDAAFRAANPDFIGVSIRVTGTFNGSDFTFESDLNVDQEFDLNPPLEITEDGVSTNVTVRIDLATWFVSNSGNLIDPATGNKGGANEGTIEDNIKDSIEAFEDRDHDGDDEDER